MYIFTNELQLKVNSWLNHSSKEEWIILLVYFVDSQLQKMSLSVTWADLRQICQLAGPSSIKIHFVKIRICPVNKDNNPLFFSAMDCWPMTANPNLYSTINFQCFNLTLSCNLLYVFDVGYSILKINHDSKET